MSAFSEISVNKDSLREYENNDRQNDFYFIRKFFCSLLRGKHGWNNKYGGDS